ncbi:MAG TPA: hypothetical protein VFH83_02185 [Spirochaetia bacterium]|nr:hypothetical protein [Spirochaetia bacterium]
MRRPSVCVITLGASDLRTLLERSGLSVTVVDPGRRASKRRDLSRFDALAILGGTTEQPLLLDPQLRSSVEAGIRAGARVFCEYCESIGGVYTAPPVPTRFERIVVASEEPRIDGLRRGDLLEDQCNTRIAPYEFVTRYGPPLLQYTRALGHDRVESGVSATADAATVDAAAADAAGLPISERALWFHHPANLLICVFRLCNFVRARFSPTARWRSLVAFVLEWLCGQPVPVDILEPRYHVLAFDPAVPLETQVSLSAQRAVRWFGKAGLLVDGGRGGVMEGLGTEISADGHQQLRTIVRNDCTGETALAFFLHSMLTGRRESARIARRLIDWCFDRMQVKDPGPLQGMMRWTPAAWQVCYADDNARVIIPQLLMNLYGGGRTHQEECVEALRFLVRTTGTDGLRVMRTEGDLLDAQTVRDLSSGPGALPSAHYNAYYLGALLLAAKLTGIEEFRRIGELGLGSIMAVYPNTRRELSETEELCRLILPLALLYWVTRKPEHRDWLYRVTEDLQRFRHPSGAYLEWDTGHAAALSRNVGGEASLLMNNGDPVVDLLYSVNWLPMGFMQACLVTGDERFRTLWQDAARFLVSCQIRSKDPLLDGAWTRAFDVELGEVFGSPGDVGWGPWAIESGWTVAEIAAGLSAGLLEPRLRRFYRD